MNVACFLHINKNAGTTMRTILRQNYPADALLDVMLQGRRGADGRAKTVGGLDEDVYQVLSEVQDRQSVLACIAANLPYGLHRVIDRPVLYFTLLREPVSRCISYWYFAHRTRHDGHLWNTLERHGFDIRRICEERAAYQLSNDQVRMIAGTSAPEPGGDEFRLACELIEERFLFAGAIEFFEPCVQVLARQFGWSYVPKIKLNVRIPEAASILPPKADEHFRETNEWDIRLYEWLVKQYLPRRLA